MVGQHSKTVESDRAVRAQVAQGAASAPPVAGQGGRGPRPTRAGGHQRRDADQPARRAQGGIPKARGHVQGGPAQVGRAQLVGQTGRREQGPGPGTGVAPAAVVLAADRHPRTADQEQDAAERRGARAGEQVDGHTVDDPEAARRVRQGRAVPVHAAPEGTESGIGTRGGAAAHAVLARVRTGKNRFSRKIIIKKTPSFLHFVSGERRHENLKTLRSAGLQSRAP